MAEWNPMVEELVYEGRIKVPYTWSVGEYGSRFFHGLKEEKRIWGTTCPECRKVFVPPKKGCPDCFVPIREWVELAKTGRLLTYTVVHYSGAMHPVKTPFAYGVIQLDGADTGLVHLVGEVDLDRIRVGMRMEAVFKEKGEGNLLDIRYFRPVQ